MNNTRATHQAGFTLLEAVLAIGLLAIIIGISYTLINYTAIKYKLSSERTNLEYKLHTLTNIIYDDLTCAVLINKGFCNFEINTAPNEMVISFFTSNNDEHVTKAVYFTLKKIDPNKLTLTKYELSSADSLFLQNTLDKEKNLKNIFTKYSPQKTIVLGTNLFDFRIRLAIRTASGGIFFTPPNANITYKKGILTYKTADGLTANIRGNLLFADITVRALPASAIQEFYNLPDTDNRNRYEFLLKHFCKSFRRIAFKSHYF